MYSIFSTIDTDNSAISIPSEYNQIRDTYQNEVNSIINYYNNRVFSVKSNHVLCKLLNLSTPSITYTIERYMQIADTRSPYIGKIFNFTSEINVGKFHKGIFYGPDVEEIIYSTSEYINPFELIPNWKKIEAVKVLYHPFSNMNLLLPNGFKHSTEKGTAFIGINIELLLLQYRCFMIEQNNKLANQAGNDVSILSHRHFVHMYVLPNMIKSHIDMVLLNRLMNIFYGAPMGGDIKKHPFHISDYSNKLDNVLELVIKRLKNNSRPYQHLLKNIPSVFNKNMQVSLVMPDMAQTRQVWWSLVLSRIKIMKFLIDIGGVAGIRNNRMHINKLQVTIKHLIEENVIEAMLPTDLYFDTIETLKDILKI